MNTKTLYWVHEDHSALTQADLLWISNASVEKVQAQMRKDGQSSLNINYTTASYEEYEFDSRGVGI